MKILLIFLLICNFAFGLEIYESEPGEKRSELLNNQRVLVFTTEEQLFFNDQVSKIKNGSTSEINYNRIINDGYDMEVRGVAIKRFFKKSQVEIGDKIRIVVDKKDDKNFRGLVYLNEKIIEQTNYESSLQKLFR